MDVTRMNKTKPVLAQRRHLKINLQSDSYQETFKSTCQLNCEIKQTMRL